eukprot:211928-Amphidinium_carterae.1
MELVATSKAHLGVSPHLTFFLLVARQAIEDSAIMSLLSPCRNNIMNIDGIRHYVAYAVKRYLCKGNCPAKRSMPT